MKMHVRLNPENPSAMESVTEYLGRMGIVMLEQHNNLIVIDMAGDQLKHLISHTDVQGVVNPENGKSYMSK